MVPSLTEVQAMMADKWTSGVVTNGAIELERAEGDNCFMFMCFMLCMCTCLQSEQKELSG